MTQTTLFSDRQLFVSLYKSALRRIKGIGFIYTLISFVTLPVFYIMEAVEASGRLAQGYSYYGLDGRPEIYSTASIILYFAVVIVGAVLISVYVNSFMHNRRAVDVFHALPVKRHQQLLANFAAVVTVLLSAQFFCYAVVAAVNAVTVGEPFGLIVLEALRVALLTVVIAVIAFFSSVCCNAGLDSAVFTGALLAIVPAYTLLVMLLMGAFVTGYSGRGDFVYSYFKFSPAVMMYQTFSGGEFSQGTGLNICYIVFIAVMLVLCCVLYKKRKSETAQSANTKSFLYQFIILATSIGGGLFFGLLYLEIWGRNNEVLRLSVVSIAFTTAIYLVFNALMSRNPRPTKSGLAGLAFSLVAVVALIICADNGFFGYEKYVPDTDKVQSVTIHYTGDYDQISRVFLNEDSSIYHRMNEGLGTTFTEPEEIDMIRDIHSDMVGYIGNESVEVFNQRLLIEYKLKNGKTVKRGYTDGTPVDIMKKLVALEDLDSFKIHNFPVLSETVENVKGFYIKDGFGGNVKSLMSLTEQQKEQLYNAIALDTVNITRQMKDQRKGPVLARIEVAYVPVGIAKGLLPEKETAAYSTAVMETATADYAHKYNFDELYTNVVFDVTQDCINTIRALEETGLAQYTQLTVPEDKMAVVCAVNYPMDYDSNKPYWNLNNTFDQYWTMDQMKYEEPARIREYSDVQQLQQLADVCQTSLYAPDIDKTFYAVAFVDKDVNWREAEEYDCMLYYISHNNAPDFVKKDLASVYSEGFYHTYITAIG